MKDLLGRQFEVGQYVAYGGRAGSHGYMAVGQVTKVDGKKVSVRPVASSGYYYHQASATGQFAEPGGPARGLQRPERAVIMSIDFEDKSIG